MENKKLFITVFTILAVILISLIIAYRFSQSKKIINTSSTTQPVSQGTYKFQSMQELKDNFIAPLSYESIKIDYRSNSDTFIVLYTGTHDGAVQTVKKFFAEAGFSDISGQKFSYISLESTPSLQKSNVVETPFPAPDTK